MFASTDNTVTLPAFTRVDAAVFFTITPRLRAQMNVENLFDDALLRLREQQQQHHARLAARGAPHPDDPVLTPLEKGTGVFSHLREKRGRESFLITMRKGDGSLFSSP